MENIGKKVRNVRKQLGLNQTEFGELMGIEQSTLSDIEKGKSKPSKTFYAYFKYRFLDNQVILTAEEQKLIKALREIDHVSRKGIYFSAINQLRESMREKEIRRDKRKKEIIENALDVLIKTI